MLADAAMKATTDIGGSLQMLQASPYDDGVFLRGKRFVELAYAQQLQVGYRSQNVEAWIRYGFRIIGRWAVNAKVV